MTAHLPDPGAPDALYVLDLSGFVFRAYYALPPLSAKTGEPTHAVHGVVAMIQKILAERRPAFFAVATDPKRDSLFRTQLYPAYKATRRETPADLVPQAMRVVEVAEAYGLPVLEAASFEADDIIATVVRRARELGLRVVIASADKDLLQLVQEPEVVMYDSMRDRVFGVDETIAKLGVPPSQVRDYLALVGDTSDNVPGVPSVGPKTASALLEEHGSLDGVYAALDTITKKKLKENLEAHRDSAYLSRELVSLRDDVPLPLDGDAEDPRAPFRIRSPDHRRLVALFGELELHRARAELERSHPEARDAALPKAEEAAFVEAASSVLLDDAALGAFLDAVPDRAILAIHPLTEAVGVQRAALVGLGLAVEAGQGDDATRRAAYVPVGHVYLGRPSTLDAARTLDALLGRLAGLRERRVQIAFHDAKAALGAFHKAEREWELARGDVDTMLASYLLEADSHSHALAAVAKRVLDFDVPSFAPPAKRGEVVRPSERPIEEAAAVVSVEAAVIAQLARPLSARLDDEILGGVMREIELPLVGALARMERAGVAIDVARLTQMAAVLEERIGRLELRCHELAGHPFQVGSPRALETILFDELGLPVKKRTKTARSTDADVLEELAELHPLPSAILELRAAQKLKSTYVDALPRQIDPSDGRVHTRFNQAVAATGRLSSSEPNLQNIPVRTEEGRSIRDTFVAPPGHVILSADYSQIELRVLAHLSGDPELVSAFVEGVDVHVKTASAIFGVPAAAVTREQRARAKTVNFAVIYGQTEKSLARNLEIGVEEARGYIDAFFSRYAGVTVYLDGLVEEARRVGAVRTMMGRRREVRDILSRNWPLRFGAERIAKNTPIQGSAADILKIAMVRLDRALREGGLASRMILTVHDELVLEVPEAELAQVRPLVRRTMEGAAELRVPLRVDDGVGPSWGAAH